MSFRERQKFNIAFPSVAYVEEEKTLENGEVIRDVVATDKELPDPELFRIENLRKAGVELEEVNSKVLGAKSVDVSKIFVMDTTNKKDNFKKDNLDNFKEN